MAPLITAKAGPSNIWVTAVVTALLSNKESLSVFMKWTPHVKLGFLSAQSVKKIQKNIDKKTDKNNIWCLILWPQKWLTRRATKRDCERWRTSMRSSQLIKDR